MLLRNEWIVLEARPLFFTLKNVIECWNCFILLRRKRVNSHNKNLSNMNYSYPGQPDCLPKLRQFDFFRAVLGSRGCRGLLLLDGADSISALDRCHQRRNVFVVDVNDVNVGLSRWKRLLLDYLRRRSRRRCRRRRRNVGSLEKRRAASLLKKNLRVH